MKMNQEEELRALSFEYCADIDASDLEIVEIGRHSSTVRCRNCQRGEYAMSTRSIVDKIKREIERGTLASMNCSKCVKHTPKPKHRPGRPLKRARRRGVSLVNTMVGCWAVISEVPRGRNRGATLSYRVQCCGCNHKREITHANLRDKQPRCPRCKREAQ